MAKGVKVSKKILMIGGVILVVVVIMLMFRSSEGFQVYVTGAADQASVEQAVKQMEQRLLEQKRLQDQLTGSGGSSYGVGVPGSPGQPNTPAVIIPPNLPPPNGPGVINPNAGSGYAGSSAPPSNLTPDAGTQFNSAMQKIKGRGADMSYIHNISTISNNAGMAAKMVDNNVSKKIMEVASQINSEKTRERSLIFFNRQLAIAKNNKKRLPLSQLLSDYLDVQLPKVLYFEIHMSSLYALMMSSALLVERCSDKNNWLFKSAETSALQRIADNELNNFITLMKTFFNPNNLPNIIKDVLTSEANIIAAGGRIPYGGLSSTLSPMQSGKR